MAQYGRQQQRNTPANTPSQKIQALLPALDYTVGILKDGYNSANLAQEEAAMTEINTLLGQIQGYAKQLSGHHAQEYSARLNALSNDLRQLVADMKHQNRANVFKDFSHLNQDIEGLRKLA